MALEIILITEYANTTITVPPTAVNKANFAFCIFEGSPWAVKKATPVITQKTTTITVATIQITFATFAANPVIVISEETWADANWAPDRIEAETNKIFSPVNLFFSIIVF